MMVRGVEEWHMLIHKFLVKEIRKDCLFHVKYPNCIIVFEIIIRKYFLNQL